MFLLKPALLAQKKLWGSSWLWEMINSQIHKTHINPKTRSHKTRKNHWVRLYDKTQVLCQPWLSRYRGSYMSAHVLLNLLNELGMRGLLSILSLFRNEFNKFYNTRARMLDSIYHMTPDIITNQKSYFCRENVKFLPSFTQHYNGRHNVSCKSINH